MIEWDIGSTPKFSSLEKNSQNLITY